MKNKIIAIANQKGGVGKTTSCINLAAALAFLEYKILLIDLDPQGNATMGSGVEKNQVQRSITDVLLQEAKIEEVIIKDTPGKFSIIPANGDLIAAEVHLLAQAGQEENLKKALQAVKDQYHFIFIDCPPSLNMLTLNALVAAQSIIIPMQCEYYALEGLSDLMNTIQQIQKVLNTALHIEGIVRTLYDPRNKLAVDVSAQLINFFGKKVYQTVIPRNVRLAEAPSHGLPILLYDKHSKGADAYLALAKEFLKNGWDPIQTAAWGQIQKTVSQTE